MTIIIDSFETSPALVIRVVYVDEGAGTKRVVEYRPPATQTFTEFQTQLRHDSQATFVVRKDFLSKLQVGPFDVGTDPLPPDPPKPPTDEELAKQAYAEKLLIYRQLQGVEKFGIDVAADLQAVRDDLIAGFKPDYSTLFLGILG